MKVVMEMRMVACVEFDSHWGVAIKFQHGNMLFTNGRLVIVYIAILRSGH